MPVHNADIANVFEEIADLLEIEGANPFRIRAYRNAARTLGELSQEARTLLERGEDLKRLPGIGDDLAAKIAEIAATGSCGLLQRLRKELPPALTELLHIPGLGPKRVKTLYHDLDVQTVEQLYRAARDGRIRALPGFGEKTELHILQEVEAHVSQAQRFKLATAAQYAGALETYLRGLPGMAQVAVAGSFRRMRETVGDLDILVTATQPADVIRRAMEHPHFTLLAHPTGRLLEQRPPYDVDMLRIVRQAKQRGCFLELNAHPERLDLLDTYCQMAKEEGVLVSVNSDAHSRFDFANLRFGIGQARRGWLEKRDVLNTRPLDALLPLIRRTM